MNKDEFYFPDINDVELGDREPFDGLENLIEYLENQKFYPTVFFCSSKYLKHLANGEGPKEG